MSNLTVSFPVSESHLHIGFKLAFCNLRTMFLWPNISCHFEKETADDCLLPWATTRDKQLPTLPASTVSPAAIQG